jgi:DNA adenine methylase
MKQLIKYPGSKWRLAPWIDSFVPEHHSYPEPYFGSGAYLFWKRPSRIETVNDLDGEVANMFEVIRDDPERLASDIFLTPYSRDAYDAAYELRPADRYQKAAYFMARCIMGHGSRTSGERTGFRLDIHGRESRESRERPYASRHWNELPELIRQCAERLKRVQIENRPALSVMERFDFPDVLMYIDPPYVLSTRYGPVYRHEMDDSDHIELLEFLRVSKAQIMISGYESELYDNMLRSWHKEYHKSRDQINHGARLDVLWMNFEPSAQIRMAL